MVINITRKEAGGYWVMLSKKSTIKIGKQQDMRKKGINKY